MIKRPIALLSVALVAPGVRGDDGVLWDSGIVPDNVTATVVSTPRLPDIRIVDEFVVPGNTVWIVTGFRYVLAVNDGWEDGGVTQVCLWTDSGGDGPLAEFYDEPHAHTRRPVGLLRGLQMHEFTAEGLELILLPGTYWIGPELRAAHGPGHAFWVTARLDAVRRQGDMSWLSPRRGEEWFRHDAMGWDSEYWNIENWFRAE